MVGNSSLRVIARPSKLSLVLPFSIFFISMVHSAIVRENRADQSLRLHDKVYTESLLFEVKTAKSKCAASCFQRQDCVSFTFTSAVTSSPGTCRGHSEVLTSSHSSQDMKGTEVYSVGRFICLSVMLITEI